MIVFEPIEHKYKHKDTGVEFTSVSKLIGSVKQEFDKQFWAEKKAKDRGITAEEVLAEWDEINKKALAKGTAYHEAQETKALNGKGIAPLELDGLKLAHDLTELAPGFYPELILYNFDAKLAGTADSVWIHEDNWFSIGDFKGLALDTPIPTETGWKNMSEIQVGDRIFDGNGKVTEVQHVSEIHYNPCYKLKFDTNEELVADHEHKWVVTYRDSTGHNLVDTEMTTEEIFKWKLTDKRPLMIRCTKVELPSADLPIDPYVLGLWLGDGNRTCGTITCINPDIWEEIRRRGYEISSNHNAKEEKAESRTIYGIRNHLVDLGMLNNKHTPNIYLRASFSQRLDLLRGFMDADGHFHRKRRRCVMCTTKEWQSDSLVELTSSLGFKPTVFKTKGSGFGKTNIEVWQICFSPHENPFLCRNKDYMDVMSGKSFGKTKIRYITNIEPVEMVPTKCLSVTSDDRTYLAGKSFIKTHNTNKKLDFKGFMKFDPDTKTRRETKMKSPVSHLPDANGMHYTLQLSIYAYMLESFGYKCRDLFIDHIIFEGDEPVNEVRYPIQYLKREVQSLFIWYKNKKK